MASVLFSAGDRVLERDNPGGHCIRSTAGNAAIQSILQAGRRSGQVVGVSTRVNRAGRRMQYVQVIWDGKRSPSEHASCRLIHASS